MNFDFFNFFKCSNEHSSFKNGPDFLKRFEYLWNGWSDFAWIWTQCKFLRTGIIFNSVWVIVITCRWQMMVGQSICAQKNALETSFFTFHEFSSHLRPFQSSSDLEQKPKLLCLGKWKRPNRYPNLQIKVNLSKFLKTKTPSNQLNFTVLESTYTSEDIW